MNKLTEIGKWAVEAPELVFRQYCPCSPEAVWDKIVHRRSSRFWWCTPEVLQYPRNLPLQCGVKFVLKFPPILGTKFIGRFDCIIRSITKHRLVYIASPAVSTGGPSAAKVSVEVSSSGRGAQLEVVIAGVNTTDRDHRILLYMLGGVLDAFVGSLEPDLNICNKSA
ncbi:SRPBCC family protein [Mycobacteroides abscessus]|uniref:SRPBCC family protein n=1 Tax=Mycobacteroides abscessus TaxID=36809 RepID=UPI000C267245|nr:hypothetical protein [Mycobacteroides abscessus]PVA73713.1 hypothetical protein DDJ37_14985 [Mycobacteroides abscessus]PVB11948.1 hypothetical protein DDJ40_16400 [Mycobacteroides abscessus]RIU20251.1 hypothetical protein D2E89_15665 [Mycobacteroides abscessus]